MIKLKQIKITSLLIISLATVLILLSIFLTCIFLNSISHLKNFAEASNKDIIRKQTTYLFLREVELKSKYYSSMFERIETHTELIAKEVENRLNKLEREPLQNIKKIKMRKTADGILYNNFSYSNKSIIFYGKNRTGKDKDKKFSQVEAITELDSIIEDIYESSVNSHDWWIALNNGVALIYPNRFEHLDNEWNGIINLFGEFSSKVSPKNNLKRIAKWSNVFKSINKNYILV
jgi:hypothetical protein